jgi:hypothetical protein
LGASCTAPLHRNLDLETYLTGQNTHPHKVLAANTRGGIQGTGRQHARAERLYAGRDMERNSSTIAFEESRLTNRCSSQAALARTGGITLREDTDHAVMEHARCRWNQHHARTPATDP